MKQARKNVDGFKHVHFVHCSAKQGLSKKEASQTRECGTATQHFQASKASMWCVVTFRSLLGGARHFLA